MRLLSCHIDNFGKLSGADRSFTGGLNALLEENGWGKSTFAAFLSAMLYGLKDSAKDEIANERRRYAPWQGGAFGGSLRLEVEGHIYRLERYFGGKRSEDRFALYDEETGLESRRYSENIGEELFGLDRASFEKTVFMGQQSLETSMTSGISARMGSLEDELADMRSYDAAMSRLDRLEKNLTPHRKTGSISRLKTRRSELRAALRAKVHTEDELDRLQKEQERQEETIGELQQEIDQWNGLGTMLSRYLELKGQREVWERLKKNEAEQKDAYQRMRGAFPGVIPEEEALAAAGRVADRLDADRVTVRERALSPEEEERLRELRKRYEEQGFPEESEKQLAGLAAQEAELEQQRIREAPSEEELARFQSLSRRYPEGIPSERKLRQAERLWRKKEELRSAAAADRQAQEQWIAEREADCEEELRAEKKKTTWLTTGAVLGLVAALCSAFMLWTSARSVPASGGTGLSGGAVRGIWIVLALCFLAGSVLLWILRGKTLRRAAKAAQRMADPEGLKNPELEERIAREDAQTERLGTALDAFGTRYGLSWDADSYSEQISILRRDGMLLDEGRLRQERYREKRFEERLAALREELEGRLERSAICRKDGESWTDLVRRLREQRTDYHTLCAKETELQKARQELETDEKRVREYLARWNMDPAADPGPQLKAAGENLLHLTHAQEALASKQREMEDFEAEHEISRLETLGPAPTTVRPEEIRETIRRLEEQRDEAQKRKLSILRDMDDCGDRLQEFQLMEEEETRVAELIATQEERYELLIQTEEYLTRARQRFMTRYLEPFKEAFESYFQLFAAGEGRTFHLDVDLNMRLEENGTHPLGALSSGLGDMVALCRRLAMVDAMYPGEKPFLILDDPFVNLDDRHLEGASRFLKQVAETYQIFYLTCHSSRMEAQP